MADAEINATYRTRERPKITGAVRRSDMQSGAASYEFIGTLASALYVNSMKIRFDTLHKILSHKGAPYTRADMRPVLCAAAHYWEHKDLLIHLAITSAFTRE